MLSRVFNLILAAVFLVLVLLFAYKEMGRSKSVSAVVERVEGLNDENLAVIKREEIEEIIKDYILDHPEELLKSLESFKKKKTKELSNQMNQYLKMNSDQLMTAGNPPVVGNPDASTKIVAFFDYNCSYCLKSYTVDQQILLQDKNVQIILRPIPVLGEKSLQAVQIALAVNRVSPEAFLKFHDDMMQLKNMDSKSISNLFKKHNIDQGLVEKEIESAELKQEVVANLEFARHLGITGTPSYIINDQLFKGFLTLDQLKEIILYKRAQGK